MCGEKRLRCPVDSLYLGSPPRVRGKAQAWTQATEYKRITPACAGKSCALLVELSMTSDHPRVCGEKQMCIFLQFCRRGSPPRVRGKAPCNPILAPATGITPACAGKRRTKRRCPALARDHPRVCGEKAHKTALSCFGTGSPPRVRGKGTPKPTGSPPTRITPACAGKS